MSKYSQVPIHKINGKWISHREKFRNWTNRPKWISLSKFLFKHHYTLSYNIPLTIRPTAKLDCIVRWNTFVGWVASRFHHMHRWQCHCWIRTQHSGSARPYSVWDNVIASITSTRPSPNADILDRRTSRLCPEWTDQHSHTKNYPHFVWCCAIAPYNVPCETTIERKEIKKTGHSNSRRSRSTMYGKHY